MEAHGGQWPRGWAHGQGLVEEPAVPGDIPFLAYAERYVSRLTGIEERTRDDYRREVRIRALERGRWPLPTIGVLAGAAGAATGIIAMLR
ncbi:hypothetical protein [Streptomyces sp. NBC_00829]|uniref:hypothetical protein n=1 Tax=Streptomyces sp. NBC_00829 TaxID=2903679 RepID=UPI00386BD9B1|nr:hypothetical protein OG293_23035 [Streptomyces sp. NBC_00829]